MVVNYCITKSETAIVIEKMAMVRIKISTYEKLLGKFKAVFRRKANKKTLTVVRSEFSLRE